MQPESPPTQTPPSVIPPSEHLPPIEPTEEKKNLFKKFKITKKWGLLIAVILLVAAGSAYAVYANNNKKVPVYSTQTNNQPKPVIPKPISNFYLADPSSITVYNPEDKTKSSIALNIDKNEDQSSTNFGPTNNDLQITANGKVIAYSTDKCSNPGGEGCDATNSYLYLRDGDKTKRIVALNAPQLIDDWVIAPDGKTIFYLTNKNSNKSNEMDLHKFTTADSKDTIIKNNIFGSSSAYAITPMYLVGNDSVRIYANGPGITEYNYSDGSLTSRNLGVNKFCKDCMVEDGKPLSPDGKSLIIVNGDIGKPWSYYKYDLNSGTYKQIVKTKPGDQLGSVFWSPNGTSITYDYGNEAQKEGFKNRFEIYNFLTGKTTVGYSDPSPNVNDDKFSKHFVELIGWSPDNAYIAFANQEMVKLYKVADDSVTETNVAAENPFFSYGHGWYTK